MMDELLSFETAKVNCFLFSISVMNVKLLRGILTVDLEPMCWLGVWVVLERRLSFLFLMQLEVCVPSTL